MFKDTFAYTNEINEFKYFWCQNALNELIL